MNWQYGQFVVVSQSIIIVADDGKQMLNHLHPRIGIRESKDPSFG